MSTRQIAPEPAAAKTAMSNAQLTHELQKLFVQAEEDSGHFANVHDEADDHAQRINAFTQAMELKNIRMEAVEKWIVAADSNNGLIKEGLKQLEATVTEQGVAIPAVRGDVQGGQGHCKRHGTSGRAGGGRYQSW